MNVLHLISSSGLFGAENMLINLVNEEKRAGLNVYIGVFENKHNPHLEIVELAMNFGFAAQVFYCSGRLDIGAVFRIREFIKSQNIELVHSHGYKSNFYAFLATLFTKIIRIGTCHTWYSIDAKLRFYEWLDKLVLRKFDQVIAVSEPLKEEIIKSGLDKDRVSVIYNGIDADKFSSKINIEYLKNEFGFHPYSRLIGVIARLAPDKGHIYLIRAIQKIVSSNPDVKCLIVGDGPLRQLLEQAVKSLRLEQNVIFTGIRKDIPQLLNLIDIFVLPSLNEGLPIAVLEAMAARRPVVVTKVGAMPAVIDDYKTGRLIEPANEDAIYDALMYFLKDPENAEVIARNGFEKIKRDFSAQGMADKYMDLYKRAVNANTGQAKEVI